MTLTKSQYPVMNSTNPRSKSLEINLVLFGQSKTGKSAFVKSFLKGKFSTKYTETIEELTSKREEINGITCNFHITDPGGSFLKPDSIHRLTEHGSAFLVFYAIDDIPSYDYVAEIIPKMFETKNHYCFPVIVCGTKCDLEEERKVPFYEGFNLAKKYRLPFFEISSQRQFQIREVINRIVENSEYFVNFRFSDLGHPSKKDPFIIFGIFGDKSTAKMDFIFQFLIKHGRDPIFEKREILIDFRLVSEATDKEINRFKQFILVYSVHDKASLNFVEDTYDKILKANPKKKIPIIIVGLIQNQVSDRQVTQDEEFIQSVLKLKIFFEASIDNPDQCIAPVYALFDVSKKVASGGCFVC